MLDVLGGGPYFVYDQPFILKFMPKYFDFTTSDMVQIQSG